MTGITIGPFSFPAGLVVALAAIAVAHFVSNALAKAVRVRVKRLLWVVLAAAVLVARAAFAARYWSAYAQAPLQVLDIRDGGLDGAAGVAAGIALAAWLGWRHLPERKALLAATLAGAVVWAGGQALVSAGGAGQGIPAVELPTIAGENTALRSFSGRPLVVNLWASWCPPCRREMPALAQAQRDRPDTTFVFVNQGESAEVVRRYLRQGALMLDHVLLDGESRVAHATGSAGLPTTLFFDARGRLVERRMGELSAATLAQRLDAIRGPGQQPSGGPTSFK